MKKKTPPQRPISQTTKIKKKRERKNSPAENLGMGRWGAKQVRSSSHKKAFPVSGCSEDGCEIVGPARFVGVGYPGGKSILECCAGF
jgi:hypothetical protein